MPTYEIGGKTFETDGPLSDADIDHIASQQAQRPAPPPGPPSDSPGLDPYAPGFDADKYKQWQDANPNALTEFGKSVARGVDTTATGTANLLRTLRADTTNNPETAQHAREMRDASMNEYKKRMADNPAEVPSYSDIKNAHDVSMYVADKLGGMSKYIASYFAGGLPGIMGTGAIDAGTQEATNPDATPTSVLTAGGLGAATGAIPVPFLKAGGGIVSKTVKDALGMGLLGTAQGLTGNIPRAVATGDPSQGLPTKEQIIDSALGGVIGGGTFGGIHGAANQLTAGAPPTRLPPDAPPQKHADARLAERLNDAAEQNSFNVKKVAYDAGNGAKAVADIVHGDVASGISGFWNDIKSTMPDPTDVGEREQLNRLDSIIKNAKTKVKARVSDDDLQFLTDRVGHTEEGRALVDLVRQSNSLTDLFKTGFKGGVSRYTDFLNPLGRGGAENGYYSSLTRALPGGAGKLVELAALYHNPALAVPMAAGVAVGRGIDALTGNRSTVARFINDNSLAPQPVDMTGASSILRARAEYEAAQNAQATQAQQRTALQKASDQFDKQQASAQQAAESARLAEREQTLRTQNRLDNNPGLGGFDRYVYDQTGIRPGDASAGVFQLYHQGKITPREFHDWHTNPDALKGGNAGNHIIDMLDRMARTDYPEMRDPNWQKQPSISTEAPQVQSVRNPAAYAAQAAGNQARVTAAMERVANSEHSSNSKQRINDAIAAIGRTNNRADAESVRQNLVQSLANTLAGSSSIRTSRAGAAGLSDQARHSGHRDPEGFGPPRSHD
jgi:hypothetical protein